MPSCCPGRRTCCAAFRRFADPEAARADVLNHNANIARHLGIMAGAQPQAPALKIPRGRTRAGDIDYLVLSFAELDAEVDAWCARLAARGVVRGDRTLIMVRPGAAAHRLRLCAFPDRRRAGRDRSWHAAEGFPAMRGPDAPARPGGPSAGPIRKPRVSPALSQRRRAGAGERVARPPASPPGASPRRFRLRGGKHRRRTTWPPSSSPAVRPASPRGFATNTGCSTPRCA